MTYQNTNVEKQTKSATTDCEDLQQLCVENSFKFDFNSTSSNLLKDIHKFDLTDEEIIELLSEACETKKSTGSIRKSVEIKHELIGENIEYTHEISQVNPETQTQEVNAVLTTSNQFTNCDYQTKNQSTESEKIKTNCIHTETNEELKVSANCISTQMDESDLQKQTVTTDTQTKNIQTNSKEIICEILSIKDLEELNTQITNFIEENDFLKKEIEKLKAKSTNIDLFNKKIGSLNEREEIPENSPEIHRPSPINDANSLTTDANAPSSTVVFKRASLDEKPTVGKKGKDLGFGDAASFRRDKHKQKSKSYIHNDDNGIGNNYITEIIEESPDIVKSKLFEEKVTIDEVPQQEDMNPFKRSLVKSSKEVKSPKLKVDQKIYKINSPSERGKKINTPSDEKAKKSMNASNTSKNTQFKRQKKDENISKSMIQSKKTDMNTSGSKRYKIVKRKKELNKDLEEIDVHKPITEIPHLKNDSNQKKNTKVTKNRYQEVKDDMDEVMMEEKSLDEDIERPIENLLEPHPYERSPRLNEY